jgi:hypothetical protein
METMTIADGAKSPIVSECPDPIHLILHHSSFISNNGRVFWVFGFWRRRTDCFEHG